MTHAELEAFCVAAAEAGAQRLRDLFGRPREIALKGRIDLVTDGDRASEERTEGGLIGAVAIVVRRDEAMPPPFLSSRSRACMAFSS